MSKKYGGLILLLSAAVLAVWLGGDFRNRLDAQNGSGTTGGFGTFSPQIPPGPMANGAPVSIPRPLEVPPLYAFEQRLEGDVMRLVVVDSETKRICVYHVDPLGRIEFVGSRNYEWDLMTDDINGSPSGLSPTEIRKTIEQRQGAGR